MTAYALCTRWRVNGSPTSVKTAWFVFKFCSFAGFVGDTLKKGDMDKLLTVPEAAEWLRLSPGTLYHLISRRAVPCVKLSKRCVRFRQSDLEQWISDHTDDPELHPISKCQKLRI